MPSDLSFVIHKLIQTTGHNHKCMLENLVKALILSEKQKSDKLREGHIQIPLHIRDLIIQNSKDGLIFLNAIRDPSDMRSNKIKSIPPNQYDWSSRAIKGGCTTIDHKELQVPHPSKPF